MRNLRKSVLALCLFVMGLGVSGHVLAASGVGPYYAMPSWDQKLQCDTPATCPRFIVLTNWNSEAVLDRETGLVWERAPDMNTRDWNDAQTHCISKTVGGRKGWRLPVIQELASLMDPANPGGNHLPPGHPFSSNVSFAYWSASTFVSNATAAFVVDFLDSAQFGGMTVLIKSGPGFSWCVRGGQGPDAR